ncbi:hypothetical protein GEOBRER4_n3561 [Citrifermentans bremense]|uniref:Uncharacterized protein n=1 Tax=Citrifermentans bremense TaxID=60035 RepID=A0A7R7FT71_9BACT|nr:hypothetical protein GEOBRER4_n3561 [Citrifermentans bremense]
MGIAATGGFEEEEPFAPLAEVQALTGKPGKPGKPGKLSRVLVSALTVPMDDFGRKDPASMSKEAYEKWYCTAYVTSVAKGVEEVMAGSRAKPIWQIASAEGPLLKKLNSLMLLLTSAGAFFRRHRRLVEPHGNHGREKRRDRPDEGDGRRPLPDRRRLPGRDPGHSALGRGDRVPGGRPARRRRQQCRLRFRRSSPAWLFPTALGSSFLVALIGGLAPLKRALGESRRTRSNSLST